MSRWVIIWSVLLVAVIAAGVFAQSATQPISVTIDSKTQRFAQPPMMVNGHVMVQLRGVFEALGAKVSWHDSNKAVVVTKGDRQVNLMVGQAAAKTNRQNVGLENPLRLIQGTVYVPLRFVGEAMGAKVSYDEANCEVVISTQRGVQPDSRVQPSVRVTVEQSVTV